jgi:hypothetical protein
MPDFTQAGVYGITFYAGDGLASDSEAISITVGEAGNQSPVLASIGSQSSSENVNLNFVISASDPDGTTPALAADNLPSGATYTDNGNGTGTFDWTPSFIQAGSYSVTFRASDGVLTDSEVVAIVIFEAGNQSPLLAAIGAQSVTEGANLNFVTTATDPLRPLCRPAQPIPITATAPPPLTGHRISRRQVYMMSRFMLQTDSRQIVKPLQ